MKICYIGEITSVIKNLQELGADIVFNLSGACDGIIITDNINNKHFEYIREKFFVPIIVNGNPKQDYHNISVLIFNEDELQIFYQKHDVHGLKQCKDLLKNLGIHYLVVALNKEQIKKHVQHQLPKAKAEKINITKAEVEKVKDTLTALVGYIYIKEGTLTSEAINKANVGAALSIVGDTDNLNDYYLDINFKRS